jgi:hypothetical protein
MPPGGPAADHPVCGGAPGGASPGQAICDGGVHIMFRRRRSSATSYLKNKLKQLRKAHHAAVTSRIYFGHTRPARDTAAIGQGEDINSWVRATLADGFHGLGICPEGHTATPDAFKKHFLFCSWPRDSPGGVPGEGPDGRLSSNIGDFGSIAARATFSPLAQQLGPWPGCLDVGVGAA